MADVILEPNEALDEAREVIDEIGLRPYRVYFVAELWSGHKAGEGHVLSRTFTRVLPTPKMRFGGSREAMESVGKRLEGDAVIWKISRLRYTREQLKGLEVNGGRRPGNSRFMIALAPREQRLCQLYERRTGAGLVRVDARPTARGAAGRGPADSVDAASLSVCGDRLEAVQVALDLR